VRGTLSEAEVTLLIAAARSLRERTMIGTLAYAGLRNRELWARWCSRARKIRIIHMPMCSSRLIFEAFKQTFADRPRSIICQDSLHRTIPNRAGPAMEPQVNRRYRPLAQIARAARAAMTAMETWLPKQMLAV
jgi:hypothetical protein